VSFLDSVTKSFLDGFAGVTPRSILICLGTTALIGLFIFFVYRAMTQNTIYDKNINMALPIVAVITAAIIMAVQSSIVVSLGTLGALSIVRFRTAIKNAMDLVFFFWAISVGIICGVGLSMLSIMMSLLLACGMFLLNRYPVARAPFLLVVNATDIDSGDQIIAQIKKHSKYYKIKSRNVSVDALDMVIEVRPDDDAALKPFRILLAGSEGVSLSPPRPARQPPAARAGRTSARTRRSSRRPRRPPPIGAGRPPGSRDW